jgi:recombination protein U
MTIRYPNGKPFKQSIAAPKSTTNRLKQSVYSNRGKSLEDDLDETNKFYLCQGIANVHKKPVPIQIVKVEYPKRSAAVIKEAYFRTPSTTDYNGVWDGNYIDFEAKETESKTSFPLKNIHDHQIQHMKNVLLQKGICFFIVRFSSLQRDFIVPFHVIEEAWDEMLNGGRKSIPLAVFEQFAIEMPISYQPRIDYLKAIQQLITKEA